MKRKLLSIILAFVAAANVAALEPSSPPQLSPSQQQIQTAHLAANIFKRFPYRPIPLDAATSERIFDRYLKSLDPEKLFFVQADIDQFSGARQKLADDLDHGDLRTPFAMFNRYEQRVADRLAYARDLLKQPLDFARNENFQFDRDKAAWPKTDDEVRDLWRKRVKNDWLQLKLAGKNDKAIRDTLDKRYAKSLSRIQKSKSEDAFQVFMDAFATSVDPHTDYFSPAASADFDISMRLSLFGIGAVLQEKDEYTTIRELVPGGPAALSTKLQVGDRIVGVGQGADGQIVDVVGTRLDEVVKLIRGAKDSTVRLDVLPADAGPDGKHKQVILVRDKISLDKQAAQKSILQVKQDGVTRQVGVITLPAFYQDFDGRRKGEKEFRSATRDVKRLLEELKKDKVDAVLIDLRNNGGGSLDEAVALTGLFTGMGPVVQERNAQGQVRIDASSTARRAWDGPLGVLINRGSASASEIFAAAIQDYGRGVVIGEPSFGKGTVQTIIDLDQMAHNEKPTFGELKMTIAQFFRINGGTTQLRGVTPDIAFPAISDTERFGESSFDNALPWSQIRAASYAPAGDMSGLVPLLKARHAARIAQDKEFQYLIEDIAELKALRKKAVLSLNEAERTKERDLREARLKLRKTADKPDGDNNKTAFKTEAPGVKKDGKPETALPDENDVDEDPPVDAVRKSAKDIWLLEAANVAADAAGLGNGGTRFAARAATSERKAANDPAIRKPVGVN
ncbi:MAG: carboxy terminal-processing peptidase [Bacillota bacterium]